MEIRRFLGLLWARTLIVVAVTAQAAVVVFLISSALPKSYEAEASIVVTAGLGTSASTDDILTAPRVGQTYAGIATTRPVLETLVADLNLPYNVTELQQHLSVDAQFDSPFITVVARDGDPERAAAIANGLATALAKLSKQPPSPGAVAVPLLAVVEPAEVPTDPSSPRVLLNTALAAIAAFAITVALLSVLAYLDDRIRRPSDLEGIPAALLGRVRLDEQPAPSGHGLPRGLEAGEAVFAGLVNHLLPGTGRVSLTSPTGGRGAGITAAGLAVAAAHLGRSTILVDANLREPYLHTLFETDNGGGLATLLGGAGSTVHDELRRTSVTGLRLLPAGPVLGDPEDLFTGRRTAEVLGGLAEEADLVVIATPPMGTTSDATIIAAMVDSTIMVVNQGTTTRGQLQAAIAGLRSVGGRILGLVLMLPPSGRAEASAAGAAARERPVPTP